MIIDGRLTTVAGVDRLRERNKIRIRGERMKEIPDPGTAKAIPVTDEGILELTIGAGAETNTLANPSWFGQELHIYAISVGAGTRAITAATAINAAGNTVMTFNAAEDHILLKAMKNASGVLVWRPIINNSVTLS